MFVAESKRLTTAGARKMAETAFARARETGISIMRMEAGLDTGPVLAQRPLTISDDDDAGSLHDKLATLGAEMMVAALNEIEAGRAHPAPQPEGATYARKIEKREALLDWNRPAGELERAVRAFNPVPGAGTVLQGDPVKVWRARPAAGKGQPGEVLQAGPDLVVACGEDALQIVELQRSGAKRLEAAQFLRGRPLAAGARFG